MTAAEEMKDKLGPALCLAKWQQDTGKLYIRAIK